LSDKGSVFRILPEEEETKAEFISRATKRQSTFSFDRWLQDYGSKLRQKYPKWLIWKEVPDGPNGQ